MYQHLFIKCINRSSQAGGMKLTACGHNPWPLYREWRKNLLFLPNYKPSIFIAPYGLCHRAITVNPALQSFSIINTNITITSVKKKKNLLWKSIYPFRENISVQICLHHVLDSFIIYPNVTLLWTHNSKKKKKNSIDGPAHVEYTSSALVLCANLEKC